MVNVVPHQKYIGVSYNGSIHALGACGLGSTPSIPKAGVVERFNMALPRPEGGFDSRLPLKFKTAFEAVLKITLRTQPLLIL